MCFFLTNLADELSELVQVALSIRSDAQFPDAAVKLVRSFKWILRQKQGGLQLSTEFGGGVLLLLCVGINLQEHHVVLTGRKLNCNKIFVPYLLLDLYVLISTWCCIQE